MKVITQFIELTTQGTFDIVDITDQVQEQLQASLLTEGNVTLFLSGSTAGISTIEYEPGLLTDLKQMFEHLIPATGKYAHDAAWNDGNGYAHMRSTLMKTSLTVPFKQGQLLLGQWQQVVFIEFDNRPRQRKVIAQFIGI